MKVFVAGATGTLGVPLVRALVARGHAVVGLTRSADRRSIIERAGGRAAVADALDGDTLARVVADARPTHVVHALTALPASGPRRPRDLRATNAVRTTGTRNLLRAAIDAGARRLVAESFLAVYGPTVASRPLDEHEPLAEVGRGPFRETVLALRDLERQLAQAASSGAIETVALRFGGFYGPGVPSTDELLGQIAAGRLVAPNDRHGLTPFIHVDDAVAATMAALERGASGSAYNIVDDEAMAVSAFMAAASHALGGREPRRVPLWIVRLVAPVAAELTSWRLPLSNARARADLGWVPRYASPRDGLRRLAHQRRDAA